MFAKLFIVAIAVVCAIAGVVERPYSYSSPVVARDGRAFPIYSSSVPVAQTYSTYSSDVPIYRTFSPYSASPVSYQTYSAPVVASPYYYV